MPLRYGHNKSGFYPAFIMVLVLFRLLQTVLHIDCRQH